MPWSPHDFLACPSYVALSHNMLQVFSDVLENSEEGLVRSTFGWMEALQVPNHDC
jgi:hypothetical protein